MTSEDIVIVDATATIESHQSDGEEELVSESEWMSLLPSTRMVRAFASVPVEAFTLIVDGETRTADDGLAVPPAGDHAAAKEIVAEFMRQTGVEPFDLGPLTVRYVMEPGGPLWGRAVDSLNMRECIGWLSGGDRYRRSATEGHHRESDDAPSRSYAAAPAVGTSMSVSAAARYTVHALSQSVGQTAAQVGMRLLPHGEREDGRLLDPILSAARQLKSSTKATHGPWH